MVKESLTAAAVGTHTLLLDLHRRAANSKQPCGDPLDEAALKPLKSALKHRPKP